jgi:Lysylphosphatidylglycerol synthase TM region
MLRIPSKAQLPLRLIAIAMSAGFFFYLIWRTGPSKLWKSLSELGWGIILVIALAGVSHFARTWGWRLTLGDDQDKISFSRLVGLRLGAEAAGQLGILGQTLGDSVRVSRMTSEIPVASGLASVTLDRGLYVVTGISDHYRRDFGRSTSRTAFPCSAPVRESVCFYIDRPSDGDVVRGAKALAGAFVERPHHRPCSLLQKLDGEQIFASPVR